MPTYRVELPGTLPGLTLTNGTNMLVVEAETSADAAALVQGHYPDSHEAMWATAVVTEITVAATLGPVINPDTQETLNYVLDIAIAGADTNASFQVVAAGDTYAEIMALMVIELNAHADITGAAFAADLLTLSDIGDDLGDHIVTATFTYGGVPIVSFLGTVTDGGIEAAVLTIATSTGVVEPSIAHHKTI